MDVVCTWKGQPGARRCGSVASKGYKAKNCQLAGRITLNSMNDKKGNIQYHITPEFIKAE